MHKTINLSTFSTSFLLDFNMVEEMRKGAVTTDMHLPKGTPKELGQGSFGAVFLRISEKLYEVALKVSRRLADRDTEHKMLALLTIATIRSTHSNDFHGDEDVEMPTSHDSAPQQTGQDQSSHMCPGLLFENYPFGEEEGFVFMLYPVLNQTLICHLTSHVA